MARKCLSQHPSTSQSAHHRADPLARGDHQPFFHILQLASYACLGADGRASRASPPLVNMSRARSCRVGVLSLLCRAQHTRPPCLLLTVARQPAIVWLLVARPALLIIRLMGPGRWHRLRGLGHPFRCVIEC